MRAAILLVFAISFSGICIPATATTSTTTVASTAHSASTAGECACHLSTCEVSLSRCAEGTVPNCDSCSCVCQKDTVRDCSKFGLKKTYAGIIAHGLHSLTPPDLFTITGKMSRDTNVLIVNPNLLDPNPLIRIFDAVEDSEENQMEHDAKDESMNVINKVLQNAWNETMDMGNFDPLERVIHAFHMRKIWGRAKKHIEDGSVVSEPALCECLVDVYTNGITEALKRIAKQLREDISNTKDLYSFLTDSLQRNVRLPKLTDRDSWLTWKRIMNIDNNDGEYLAQYLHCLTKDA